MTAMTNGSRNERWFEAMIAGPVAGMCSRPIRPRRNQTWKNGCSTARTHQ